MEQIKKFPIGIQDFEKLRNGGYAYIDKTAIVYRLVNSGCYYFLSRPRRFGKSLLVSTLDAYLSGKRELFDGLAIAELETKWTKHPILHMDLNNEDYVNESSLFSILNRNLLYWESLYGTAPGEDTVAGRFEGIIRRAYEKTGERVVILVDEYDKPMLKTIGNAELQDKYRSMLKAFYSNLKTQDRYIKFALLTGVTKSSKVSVFSDLNNLDDISMDERYIDICGITEQEIHDNFDEDVERLAARERLTKDKCYAELKKRYDGYHFEDDTVGIYNPFSLLNTLAKSRFGNYWFESGTPSFLVHLLKQTNYDLRRLPEEIVSKNMLSDVDSFETNPAPIIYQSGYLTIIGRDEEFGFYRLGFPNEEVEHGFIDYLIPMYTPIEKGKTEFFIGSFINDIESGNVENMMNRLQAMFASGDYRIVGNRELYFQNSMFLIFKMLGFYIKPEVVTSRGRVDVVMQTADYIYIFEIKLDSTAADALQQIKDNGYADQYKLDPRHKFLIGVNFSLEERGINEWIIE